MSDKNLSRVIIATICCLLLSMAFVSCTPQGRRLWNSWFHDVQMADDSTRYAARRQVEDSCRAMLSSYHADLMTWRQYREADGEKLGWAEQARMRANRTAATYNEYVIKNRYVWRENVPSDINDRLEYL